MRPKKARRILSLFFWTEKSCAEIARECGVFFYDAQHVAMRAGICVSARAAGIKREAERCRVRIRGETRLVRVWGFAAALRRSSRARIPIAPALPPRKIKASAAN